MRHFSSTFFYSFSSADVRSFFTEYEFYPQIFSNCHSVEVESSVDNETILRFLVVTIFGDVVVRARAEEKEESLIINAESFPFQELSIKITINGLSGNLTKVRVFVSYEMVSRYWEVLTYPFRHRIVDRLQNEMRLFLEKSNEE